MNQEAEVHLASCKIPWTLIEAGKVRNSSAFRYVPLTPIAIAAYEKLAAGKKPGDLLCSKIKGGD